MRRSALSGKPPGARTNPGHRTEPRDEACTPLCCSFRPISVDHGRTSPAGLPSMVAPDAHAGSGGGCGLSRLMRPKIAANSVLGTVTSASWKTK